MVDTPPGLQTPPDTRGIYYRSRTTRLRGLSLLVGGGHVEYQSPWRYQVDSYSAEGPARADYGHAGTPEPGYSPDDMLFVGPASDEHLAPLDDIVVGRDIDAQAGGLVWRSRFIGLLEQHPRLS